MNTSMQRVWSKENVVRYLKENVFTVNSAIVVGLYAVALFVLSIGAFGIHRNRKELEYRDRVHCIVTEVSTTRSRFAGSRKLRTRKYYQDYTISFTYNDKLHTVTFNNNCTYFRSDLVKRGDKLVAYVNKNNISDVKTSNNFKLDDRIYRYLAAILGAVVLILIVAPDDLAGRLFRRS